MPIHMQGFPHVGAAESFPMYSRTFRIGKDSPHPTHLDSSRLSLMTASSLHYQMAHPAIGWNAELEIARLPLQENRAKTTEPGAGAKKKYLEIETGRGLLPVGCCGSLYIHAHDGHRESLKG